MKLRWIIAGITAVAIVSAGAAVYHLHHPKTATTLPDDTYVATVQRGDITQEVSAAGTVASNLDVRHPLPRQR